jgi:hypothetical protein
MTVMVLVRIMTAMFMAVPGLTVGIHCFGGFFSITLPYIFTMRVSLTFSRIPALHRTTLPSL